MAFGAAKLSIIEVSSFQVASYPGRFKPAEKHFSAALNRPGNEATFQGVLIRECFFILSVAISQREYTTCYDFLIAHQETIRQEIVDFFQRKIRGKFPEPNCEELGNWNRCL